MTKHKGKFILFFMSITIILCSCCAYVFLSKPSVSTDLVTMREFLPCKGWNSSGQIIEVATFSHTEKQLLVCGHIEQNRYQIAISVSWFYKNKLIKQDVIKITKEQFTSTLSSPMSNFEPGIYKVKTYIGRYNIRTVTIQVK